MNFRLIIYFFNIMSKNNLQSKTQIIIIGGASKIARETFKLNHE